MHQSVRPSPVFLAIVAITAVGGVLAWLAAAERKPMAYVGVFTFVIAGWIVSLCLHEFGHAFTAWRFGDHDVAVRGYLTLNPLKYSNPLLSIWTSGADHAAGRHRPARRRGVGADVVHDELAEDDRQPGRSVHERGVRRAAAGDDPALFDPGAHGVLGRDGVPGLPAGHRRSCSTCCRSPGWTATARSNRI